MQKDYSKLVFVVGIVRSGTSLLYSIINQHPSIGLMYECDVWSFPGFLSKKRFEGNWLERQEFFNSALSRHRLIYGGKLNGLEHVRDPEQLYKTYSSGKQAAFYGEKSPFYSTRLADLAQRYPGCSFIVIWRDPVEICQSVTTAGRRSRFFRRSGMLDRLIYYQEEMIRQSRILQAKGLKVHHITYEALVTDTKKTCTGICDFLGLDFEPRMLDLTDADFSPVFKEEHHDRLRAGTIGRRNGSSMVIPEKKTQKLRRYQSRWARLTKSWINYPAPANNSPEPGVLELGYHGITGKSLNLYDAAKRLIYEFAPLQWLKTYRRAKRWYLSAEDVRKNSAVSMFSEFKAHWQTLIACYALLGIIVIIDSMTGPAIVLGPFYLLPLIPIIFIAGRRWGTQMAIACALAITFLQASELTVFHEWHRMLWNCFMRFTFFEIVVILLDRIRLEYLRSPESKDSNLETKGS